MDAKKLASIFFMFFIVIEGWTLCHCEEISASLRGGFCVIARRYDEAIFRLV